MARAALRALQICPSLREAWSVAQLQPLLLHADADVRWCGVECIVLLTHLVRIGSKPFTDEH